WAPHGATGGRSAGSGRRTPDDRAGSTRPGARRRRTAPAAGPRRIAGHVAGAPTRRVRPAAFLVPSATSGVPTRRPTAAPPGTALRPPPPGAGAPGAARR